MRFIFRLENFNILTTRSKHKDTVWVLGSQEIGGVRTPGLVFNHGDHNDVDYAIDRDLATFDADDGTSVKFTYSLINKGSGDDAEVAAQLQTSSEQIFDQHPFGEPWDTIGQLFTSVAGFFLPGTCDGPLVGDLIATNGAVLKAWTAASFHRETREYPGTDSAAGCGGNSVYRFTWSVRRA